METTHLTQNTQLINRAYSYLMKTNLEAGIAELIKSKNNADICRFIFDKNCQLYALKAYEYNLITLQEFCTLSALVQLIEDHTQLKLTYANVATLKIYPIYSNGMINEDTTKFLRESLRVNNSESFIDEDKFQIFLKSLDELPALEQSFMTVELIKENEHSWPMMLKVLSKHTRSFFPLNISGKMLLVISSFSMKKNFIAIAFGKDFAVNPAPILGSIDICDFLNLQSKGKRAVSYNFPTLELLDKADLLHTGKFFYSEHDWSHLEESSMIPPEERNIFIKFNLLAFENKYGFSSITLFPLEKRIFIFGDLELKIYKSFWEEKLKANNKLNIGNAHKELKDLRYAYILITLLQVLGFPMGYSFLSSEVYALELHIYGNNSTDANTIRTVPSNTLENLQNEWNHELNIYIKKLLTDFVINRGNWIENFNFDPFLLDWDLAQDITRDTVINLINTDFSFSKYSIDELQNILRKFSHYLSCCKTKYESASKNAEVGLWNDVLPNFSFQSYSVNFLEFHIGRGIIIKKDD